MRARPGVSEAYFESIASGSTRGGAAGDATAGADGAGDGGTLAGCWLACGRLATGGGGVTPTGAAEGDAFGVSVPGAK
jgi:hypothetical protein